MPNSPIDIALTEVNHRISQELLRHVFSGANASGVPIPVHESIRQNVIIDRVLKECNLAGGKIKQIPLKSDYEETVEDSGLFHFIPDYSFRLYRIPPAEREGVEIAAPLSVAPPSNHSAAYPYTTRGNAGGGAGWSSGAYNVLNSHTYGTHQPQPLVEPMAGDLVRISPATFMLVDWILTVRLCYDENFTNMNNSAIKPFADLTVAAVKSYIYNQLALQMGRISVEGGVELPNIREIVESYEPAEEEYQQRLKRFKGAALLDPARKETILRYMIGG